MNIYKELREKKNLSVRGLGKELGISPSHISEIERDVSSPSLQMLIKYHKFFDVTLEYLMGEENEEEIPLDIEQFPVEIGNAEKLERITKWISSIINSSDEKDILEKQALEYLLLTPSGKILLNEFAELLYGVTNMAYNDGEILQDFETGDYHRIHHESMVTYSQQFAKAVVALREPKYNKLRSNDLKMIIMNMEECVDTYSEKCRFE